MLPALLTQQGQDQDRRRGRGRGKGEGEGEGEGEEEEEEAEAEAEAWPLPHAVKQCLIGQKLVENAKNSKIQMRHFE